METHRIEAFTGDVVAIALTIMVASGSLVTRLQATP
jgi:hypothetical protein